MFVDVHVLVDPEDERDRRLCSLQLDRQTASALMESPLEGTRWRGREYTTVGDVNRGIVLLGYVW